MLDHLEQRPHHVIASKPLTHVHRQQKLLIPINPPKTPRHPPIQRSPRPPDLPLQKTVLKKQQP
ncbi:hypothetical protein, partial [Actinoallomurus acaciae]